MNNMYTFEKITGIISFHDSMRFLRRTTAGFMMLILLRTASLSASELYIGAASVDITPSFPVALEGQFNIRIATAAETPLTANVIALESREGNRSADAAIMISCDLVGITDEMVKKVREEVHSQLPELDVSKIILNATHTHTAPVLKNDLTSSFRYPIPKEGILQPEEYISFMTRQVAAAVVKAWQDRRPGTVSWGLSHAVIAYNRRTVYSETVSTPGAFGDGTARMYGKTDLPEFRNMESMEDHDVNTLFFWDKTGKLLAMSINIPCTAQLVEHRTAVNADYWHPVRERLKQRFGQDLVVLGSISAAGDNSPRPLFRIAAEERMTRLRNLNGLEEIARRIVLAVEEAYQTVNEERHDNITLVHWVDTLNLPVRLVTRDEYLFSKAESKKYADQIAANPKSADDLLTKMTWNNSVVERFEKQKNEPDPGFRMELHVLRIGDVVVCTNPFELFTDYGIRMKARSKALQTFVVQLAGDGGYLPTEKAVEGGGYSAVVQSVLVGPQGGQILVDETVKVIGEIFPANK